MTWAMTGSNRRHPPCKGGALPAELIAQDYFISLYRDPFSWRLQQRQL